MLDRGCRFPSVSGRTISGDQAPGFWVSERKHRAQGGASDTGGGSGVPGTWRRAFCFFPRGRGWPMAGAHLWANPALKMPPGTPTGLEAAQRSCRGQGQLGSNRPHE